MCLDCTHIMRFPCCMDPIEYIVYFGDLSGNQALVHHFEDSNTKVKIGLVCFCSFYLWQITVMSDKKFACRTNFKLYQTFCLVKIFITRVSEVIMFSPCVFVCVCVCGCLCLSRCLSGRFNYEGLVPHKQYFAGTLLGMSSCASYVSRTHDVIDDVTRSQSRSNFEIDISPSIFELQRRSKAQNVGNADGYLSGIFNFRYNFR